MSSSTSVAAPLPLRHGRGPTFATKAQPFLVFPNHCSGFPAPAAVRASPPPARLLAAAGASSGERDNRVQELRVPDYWLTPAGAAQESEWLRETLHKWLDDEYCPEPANVDISRTAARSYHESLTAGQSDVGEILMKMISDLEKLSYRESFHGAFSAANAAIRLITQKMESLSEE
ncbi:hypothetical protein PR202_gb23564 [Eleusine coracana subsp. coracana]|uniref:Uncharacterized protein n=1 Tax=Eleusine coracana subsp. coracana TaxID=191504 RepID=A0AAV5FIY5_ELECO|nr:hypothetical protein QOZ80_5BG0441100 [Eleusine coracana subsp. coracana]GJN34863.1 hypothetical protein PR202_gb23564 [Eleusine coracana subsp. coracana]